MKIPVGKVNGNRAAKNRAMSRAVVALVSSVLFLGACSEEKSPPDDEGSMSSMNGGVQFSGKTTCSSEFHACALSALEAFSLTLREVEHLSSCSFEAAASEVSDLELFEQARSQVRSRCQ